MSSASPVRDSRPEASVERILSLTRAEMDEVNRMILALAGSNVALIPEIAEHLISSGGKRLRPMLTIASALACGYRGTGHVRLAASVEFMHTATLLHDDVVDESALRRGKKSARMIWGNQASVLVGDFLLGQAFKTMVGVGSLTALDILSRASAVIAEGEVWQLSAAKKLTTTESDYLSVIEAKTAVLFAAATEVGPVLAEAGDEVRAAMRAYGLNLGRAFQLADDVLDYRGSTASLGKNTGDDFREGKITMPVIVAHARGTAAEQDFWRRAMEAGETDDSSFAEACRLMERHGALEATVRKAKGFAEAASGAIRILPRSEARQALLDVVAFAVDRVN